VGWRFWFLVVALAVGAVVIAVGIAIGREPLGMIIGWVVCFAILLIGLRAQRRRDAQP
jgi:hypothetical protein